MNDEEIVRKYSDMIYGVAMRYVRNRTDADDVYSDVFYRYFRRQRTFDSEEHRKAWLLRVTVNCSKDFVMNRGYSEEIQEDMFGSETLYGTTEASAEDILAVREAIKKLDDEHREIIELYYFSGLSVSEIGQMLQKSVNTVKSQLLRGRNKLKELLV
ncbi:MAG: sigma-70 family RNA polymerase sigma factor [Ruminococcus sp.]|nr:sigma-70 family RNA polymerase sigma factor [Ruminococcus sp.]